MVSCLKGPKGEKRPANVIGSAIKFAKIATGKIEEDLPKPEDEGFRRRAGQRLSLAAVAALIGR